MKYEVVFEKYIKENNLIELNEKILVALSGGVDSVFLLYMLMGVRDKYRLEIEAFHLNHNLRENAIRDEMFCVRLCESLGIKLHNYSVDIRQRAECDRISLEQAGRNVRYEIITKLTQENDYNKVATAHHKDDNAETILMHIIRGSGISGLSGIPLRRKSIIRPILDFTKVEIYHYMHENNYAYVEDETNYENDYFRNRVRNEIIPRLKQENKNITRALSNLATSANLYEDYFDSIIDESKIGSYAQSYYIKYDDLSSLHEVLQYKYIKLLTDKFDSVDDISYVNLRSIIDMLKSKNTIWKLNVHKLIFERVYDKLYVYRNSYSLLKEDYKYDIHNLGVYIFTREGFKIQLTVKPLDKKSTNIQKYINNTTIKVIDYDKIINTISIRSKNDKDMFSPLNFNGRKTINRYFIDKKIPYFMRNQIPILVDGDNVLAILGYEIDKNYKVSSDTKKILIIEFSENGVK